MLRIDYVAWCGTVHTFLFTLITGLLRSLYEDIVINIQGFLRFEFVRNNWPRDMYMSGANMWLFDMSNR